MGPGRLGGHGPQLVGDRGPRPRRDGFGTLHRLACSRLSLEDCAPGPGGAMLRGNVMDDVKDALVALIQEANDAWRAGRPEAVASLFHEDAVLASPTGDVIARGRDAIVQSYVDFCRVARTIAFEASGFDVHAVGDTAIVRYTFDVTYEMEGVTSVERGHEILTFVGEGDSWRAMWRIQLPSTQSGC